MASLTLVPEKTPPASLSGGPAIPTLEVLEVELLVCKEPEPARKHYVAIVNSRSPSERKRHRKAATRAGVCYFLTIVTGKSGIIECSREVDVESCTAIHVPADPKAGIGEEYYSIFPLRY